MLAHGIQPRDIVAITFTEAAASELLERIQGFVASVRDGTIPPELARALPSGLSVDQRIAIANAAGTLDEITCTTIHGFCQQLIKPYPIEARIDPKKRNTTKVTRIMASMSVIATSLMDVVFSRIV